MRGDGNFFDEDGEDDFEGGEDDLDDFDESSEEEVENFAAKNANKRAKNWRQMIDKVGCYYLKWKSYIKLTGMKQDWG